MLVVLKKHHEHEGKRYEPGAEIEVSATDASWLKGLGIAAEVKPATTKKPKPEQEMKA